MPRIAGVDIPADKQVRISLTYIFGIGHALSTELLGKVGIDGAVKAKDLTDEELGRIATTLEQAARGTTSVRWSMRHGSLVESVFKQPRVSDTRLDWIVALTGEESGEWRKAGAHLRRCAFRAGPGRGPSGHPPCPQKFP